MLLTRGLGDNIQPSSFPSSGGQITTGTFVPRGITWTELEAKHRDAATAMGNRLQLENSMIAQTLGPCPGSWPSCGQPMIYSMSMAPGSFQFFGFPFHVAELKDGRFDRRFTLDEDQRTILEWAVAARSREAIAYAMAAFSPGDLTWTVIASVNDILGRIPDARLKLPNFTNNSIQPTADELTGTGGFRSFTDRGGFFLSYDIANGHSPFYASTFFQTCTSILCSTCSGTRPACVMATIGKNGLVTDTADITSNGSWSPYVAFVSPTEIRLVLVFDDPAWYKRMANAIAEGFSAMADALCTVAPIAQSQLQTIAAEKCADKAGKPCTKGTVGCKCVTPNGTTQASVGLTNFYLQQWCKEWGAEQQTPLPLPPPDVRPPVWASAPPWGWIIAGGLLVGAIMFNRKQP
jgi:hypothetical protein